MRIFERDMPILNLLVTLCMGLTDIKHTSFDGQIGQ